MKKLYILISIISLTFIAFLIVVFIPKNYELNYKINDCAISESYLKNDNSYLFLIKYQNVEYPLLINNKYSHKRKLIKNIKINKEEPEICLDIIINNNIYYICSNNNELKMLHTMSNEFLKKHYNMENNEIKEIQNYNNISIYNLDYKYYIWNYKGFYYISNKNTEELNIFTKDNYKNYLTYQTNNYLIYPDYDSEYYFKKIYIYNISKNIEYTIYIEDEISFDSYYLGDVNNKVYFIDKKNKKEYEIDLKKKYIKQISKDNIGYIYENNTLKETSLNKIINNEIVFANQNIIHYLLEENTLYILINNQKIKVSNNKVKQIIYQNNNEIYYLSDNKVYTYNYLSNENLLLKYDEWNFNYNNHIFIFN